MFKKMKIFTVMIIGAMLSGCTFEFSVSPNETAYLYKTDIYESKRYNPGSDYQFILPFETKRQILFIDYGTTTTEFPIDYTLTDKQNKTRVISKAIITYKLSRNPNDSRDLQFKDDLYSQYFTKNVKARSNGEQRFLISPNDVFDRLMNETLDKEFRKEFTNQDKYPDFDSIEGNIEVIRDRIKEALVVSAKDVNIEIIGLSIQSPVVPDTIQESRDNMLKLQQEALNTTKELQIKSDLAAGRMAVDVREAINEVIVDKIAGVVNKEYLLIKTLNRAIDNKLPINLSLIPFMRNIRETEDSGKNQQQNEKESIETFNKYKDMTNEELIKEFSKE